ncbi:MAG: hypothetical protein JST04_07600 [Bdellovibrionales bacterium]|nr:hypothetical protein [Bdellovibrionales bacterium]
MQSLLSFVLKSALGIGIVASVLTIIYAVFVVPALVAPAFVALFTLSLCAIPTFYADELRATYDDHLAPAATSSKRDAA